MRSIYTIAEREFRAFVTSPVGYVVMLFFLLVTASFFIAPLEANVASLRYVVGNMVIWLVFLLPALTMRLVAEEKKQGTIELLMTSPITETQAVLGKFFGALAFYAVILFSTLPYVFVLGWVRQQGGSAVFPTYTGLLLTAATLIALTVAVVRESRPLGWAAAFLAVATILCAGFSASKMGEWGPAVTGYLGLFLLGAVFLAIGLLTSTLTSNQIVAWVSTAAILLTMVVLLSWIVRNLAGDAPKLEANAGIGTILMHGLAWVWHSVLVVLQGLDLQASLDNFAQGVLDLRDFVLYLSIIIAALFFSIRGLTTTRAA
ncbi:MAG: ABC transporter permease [Armatimonadota bacterium]